MLIRECTHPCRLGKEEELENPMTPDVECGDMEEKRVCTFVFKYRPKGASSGFAACISFCLVLTQRW